MTEHYTCRHCGETILTTPIWMNESPLCESCAEEMTVLCSHCGERIYRDDNAGDESTPLCQDCYDRHYTNCHNCGDLIRVIHRPHERQGHQSSGAEKDDRLRAQGRYRHC